MKKHEKMFYMYWWTCYSEGLTPEECTRACLILNQLLKYQRMEEICHS